MDPHNEVRFFECPSCCGSGSISVYRDDNEDIYEECPSCDGVGQLDYDPENTDSFIPERDALTIND